MAGLRTYSEVGTVPGTYRIIDLFCLKEVLNQIMRCSCDSDDGFTIYQVEQEETVFSFHSILDIMCKHCKRKICFGTSIILGKEDETEMEPDVDIKMDKILEDIGLRRCLWNEFYETPINSYTESTSLTLDYSRGGGGERTMKTDFRDSSGVPELFVSYSNPVFSREDRLIDKQEEHKSQFQCDTCSKSFNKLFNLKQHMRIHSVNKLLCKYEDCDRSFNDKSSMNKHIKTVHMKEKSHICKLCAKSFTRASHVREHMAMHTKEKNFKCPECNKSFNFLSTLNRHGQVHSGIKRFKCDHCCKGFKWKKSLVVHLASVHQVTMDSNLQPKHLAEDINEQFLQQI